MSLFVSFSLFNNFRLHSIHHLAITFYLLRIFNFENQFTFGLFILFSLPSHFETMVGKFEFSNVYPWDMVSTFFNPAQIVDETSVSRMMNYTFSLWNDARILDVALSVYLIHLCLQPPPSGGQTWKHGARPFQFCAGSHSNDISNRDLVDMRLQGKKQGR